MIYDIRHLTLYEYGSTVTFSHCALRLLPIDGPGQTVLSSESSDHPGTGANDRAALFLRQSPHLPDDRNGASQTDRRSEYEHRDRPRRAARRSATPAFEEVREASLRERLARQGVARPFPAPEPPRAALRARHRLCAGKLSGRAAGACRRQGVDAADPGRLQI